MSGEGNKPSGAEIAKIHMSLNGNQLVRSIERERDLENLKPRLENLRPRKDSLDAIVARLDTYNAYLSQLEITNEAKYPPEWKTDLGKAKKIQLEIRQKLAELDGLFKLD